MTEFQQLCYQTLKTKVPVGKVITYGGLAALVGRPKASRAVGSAMHKNPFSPEVPCHRVVRANGELGGFAKGVERKIQLLQREGVIVKAGKIVNFEQHLRSRHS